MSRHVAAALASRWSSGRVILDWRPADQADADGDRSCPAPAAAPVTAAFSPAVEGRPAYLEVLDRRSGRRRECGPVCS